MDEIGAASPSPNYQLIQSQAEFRALIDKLLATPDEWLALDTERVDGRYYTNQLCLLQLRAPSVGTAIIDTLKLPDLKRHRELFNSRGWILHSAVNDLPFLREAGIYPPALFDTQIAAQLCGYQYLGLGALIAEICGVQLPKNHSHERWNRRPLPSSWLDYAANDVVYLHDLVDALSKQLHELGRWEWFTEECEYILKQYRTVPKPKTWLDVKGSNRLTDPLQREALRQLYLTRDKIAKNRDLPPHFVVADRDILRLARELPSSPKDEVFQVLPRLRFIGSWLAAIKKAKTSKSFPPAPPRRSIADVSGIKNWYAIDPLRAFYLHSGGLAVDSLAAELGVRTECLINRPLLRQVCASWDCDSEVGPLLADIGLRNWQIELLTTPLEEALQRAHRNFDPEDDFSSWN